MTASDSRVVLPNAFFFFLLQIYVQLFSSPAECPGSCAAASDNIPRHRATARKRFFPDPVYKDGGARIAITRMVETDRCATIVRIKETNGPEVLIASVCGGIVILVRVGIAGI